MNITYSYMGTDRAEHRGTWRGKPDTALAAGVERLDATEIRDGEYVYLADETGIYYLVDTDDVRRLGAGVLAGRDVYSLWCASCGSEADPDDLAAAAAQGVVLDPEAVAAALEA